jgi:hypothetical protein
VAAALTVVAGSAQAAPHVDFVATPVQGTTCAAPCAIHFDAIGNGSNRTTDAAFTRPFHTLTFEWDFGDPDSGSWTVTGKSRNYALGAIAGHLYERPGTYVVTLAVTNPDGQTGSLQRAVTVADPDTAFSATQTWCFANSGVPGGAGFEHCPVAQASQHVVIAASVADGWNRAVSRNGYCSAAAGTPRRCLFRSGDTFLKQGEGVLGEIGARGLIDRFGPGARPRVVGSGSFASIGADGWTVANLDVEVSGEQAYLFKLQNEVGHATAWNLKARGLRGGCFVSQGTGAQAHSDLVAVIEVDCMSAPLAGMGGGGFFRTERTLVLGTTFDNNYQGEFTFRTIHWPRSVLAHSRLTRPQDDATNTRNVIQLRAWAGTSNTVPGTPPTPTDTEWVIIADNVLSQATEDSVIRTCQGNECNSAPQSPELQNVVMERNFFFFEQGGCCGNFGMTKAFWLQGGDITVRNNVLDLRGIRDGEGTQAMAVQAPNMAGSVNDDNVHVLNNTVFYDDRISVDDFRFCGSSTGAGHRCHNNLAYLPQHSGDEDAASGGSWQAANNVFAAASPFAAPIPPRGSVDAADFQLGPQAGQAIDEGMPLDGGGSAVVTDFGVQCRPAGGDWDVGAWEYGSDSSCLLLAPEPGSISLALGALAALAACARRSRASR